MKPTSVPLTSNKNLTIINLLSGPGSGKSVLRADTFSLMKKQGIQVEEVTEFAKDLVWDQRFHMFHEQDVILSEQYQRFRRLVLSNIRVCITDTSLLLGYVYAPKDYFPTFFPHMLAQYHSFNNINIFLKRGDFKYEERGRNETKKEAIEKDFEVLDKILMANELPFHLLTAGNPTNPQKIIDIINGYNSYLITPTLNTKASTLLKVFGPELTKAMNVY
jgi:hypothetical protein